MTQTTTQISDNIIAQLESTLNQTISLLPRSFNRVLAKAIAGVWVTLYKYIGAMSLQTLVSTASTRETTVNGRTLIPLEEWGVLIGVGRRRAATQAQLSLTVTVNNQSGSIPAGEAVYSTDNGVTYLTTAAVLLNAATVTVNVLAASDQTGGNGSGVQGNLQPGDTVSFVRPVAGIERVATVASQVTTAANAQSWDAYRITVQDRFRRQSQGGAPADYELWGESVAGIPNVYPYTSPTPGQVNVYVEATVASSGDPNGIPTNAQLQAVRDAIDFDQNGLASRRQISAMVNTFPIERLLFDTTVTGLSVPDAATVQAAITTALTDYYLQRAPFIVGLTFGGRMDIISQTAVSGIVSGIVGAAGGQFTSVTVLQGGVSVTQQTLGEGQKAGLGTLTFV